MQTVGETIASLRRDRRMTQEELAASLGVSAQSVSKWENNVTMPDILLLPVIAGIFEVTVDELFSMERPGRKGSWPMEEAPSAVYRAVIETMWDWDTEAQPELTIKNLKSNPTQHTGFVSRLGGGVYANRDMALVMLPEGENDLALLENEAAAEFLAAMADASVRKIIKHLMEKPGVYTAASLAALCHMDEKDARTALERLENYDLVQRRSVDLGAEEKLDVYSLFGGHRIRLLLWPLLSLAGRLADFHEDWCGFRN